MTIPANRSFSLNDALNSLGQQLQHDFETAIAEYSFGWFREDYLIGEDYEELLYLEQGIRQVLQIAEDFGAFEEWLTSGFIPQGISIADRNIEKAQGQEKQMNLPGFNWQNQHSDYSPSDLITKQRSLKPHQNSSSKSDPVKISPEQDLRSHPRNRPVGLKELAQFLSTSESSGVINAEDIAQINSDSTETPVEQGEITAVKISPEQDLRSQPNHKPAGLKELPQLLNTSETSGVINAEGIVEINPELSETPVEHEGITAIATDLEQDLRSQPNHKPAGLKELAQFISASEDSYEIVPNSTAGKSSVLEEKPNSDWQPNPTKIEPEVFAATQISHTGKSQELFVDDEELIATQQNQLTPAHQSPRSLNQSIDWGENRNFASNVQFSLINSTEIPGEIDLDLVFEALTEEINREYRRFYGG